MSSNFSTQSQHHETSHWFQSLQGTFEGWVRQEIIDEDPYDEEQVLAQQLYEQFLDQKRKQIETLSRVTSFQPISSLWASEPLHTEDNV